MDELDLNPDLGSYKFIRLGENYGDVEERGNDSSMNEIRIIHEIHVPKEKIIRRDNIWNYYRIIAKVT